MTVDLKLNGLKTYLGFIAWGVLGICEARGWLSAGTLAIAYPLAQTLTGVGVAHKLAKMGGK